MRCVRIFALAAITLFAGFSSAQTLQIVHFDIGQGDATLIRSPSGETMLVDAGYAGEPDIIRLWLVNQGIDELTYSVATHYHADHIGEFVDLYNSGYLPTVAAYDRGDNPGYTTVTYSNYIAAAAPARQTLDPGDVIDLGSGVTATAVCVNGHLMNGASYSLNDENERSICLLVEYHNFRYVVSGDLGGGAGGLYDLETPCANLIGDIQVFEVNHHGSYSSTNLNWLNTLQAEAAVVSLEDDNSYGFVHDEVTNRITANPHIQALYHTEEGFNLSSKSVVVNNHVILETNGWSYFDIAGDHYVMGPEIYLDIWVDASTVLPIPPTGGTLFWNLEITNLETYTLPVNVEFWLEVPNYGAYSLINLEGFDLPPLPTGASRLKQVFIPGGAPAGEYQLIGEIRDEDDYQVYASDADIFTKSGVNGATSGGEAWFASVRETGDFLGTQDLGQAADFYLEAYPQPFNAEVTLQFNLLETECASLKIYNVAGQVVEIIHQGMLAGGQHSFTWNAADLPAGVYLAKFGGENSQAMKKLVFLK